MEKQKVTLTKVAVSDTKKDGTKLVTKNGNPFWKVGILTNEHGDKWINGLSFDPITWKEGDTVELMIGEEEYNGVKRLKFELVKQTRGGTFTDEDRDTLKRVLEQVNWLVQNHESNDTN